MSTRTTQNVRAVAPVPGIAEAPPSLEDPRLIAALEDYLAALESGREVDRQAFLAAHPDLAGALAECLEGMDALHRTPLPRPRPAAVARAEEALPETVLGDFRILREIGRGGMGIVYEAQQISLRRRVALKVLPFASVLDPRQLQRFQNEAQAAACLHHTSIVPVFAVGCERGVHYYAMQYIEGQTLAALVQHLRPSGMQERSEPSLRTAVPGMTAPEGVRPGLTSADQAGSPQAFFRTVAEWGIQAADALAHAHQVGVVHRDVKPANLIVDGRGSLWVTDFGLAQVQGDTRLTLTGDLVGTFRYMSPEQAAGKLAVDHRTDIYSLGATLYEVLTLAVPFDGGNRQELLRQIDHEDPPPPRTLNRSIPADLETIVLKAMAKLPDERYAAAGELAADLRRFLEHKPVKARRPTALERLTKWSRRHRTVVASAAALLVMAAAGLAVSTALIAQEQQKTKLAHDRIADEQIRTQAAYEAEARERARAEESFRQARQAIDFLSQIAEEELPDRPEFQPVRRKLLEAAVAYYRDFIEQRREDPSTRAELAASHLRIARILEEIGSKADAQASLDRANQILETLSPDQRAPFGRGRRGFLSFGGTLDSGILPLLAHRKVQQELKLSEELIQKVAKLQSSRREAVADPRKLTPEELRDRFTQLAADEKTLLALLSAEQSQRLKQIILQQRGVQALAEIDVADVLHLLPEQREKIRGLVSEGRRSQWGPPRPPGDARRRPEKLSRSVTEQLLGVLTEKQKTQWQEMTGDPCPVELPPPFGGPMGGPLREFSRPPRP